MNSALNFLVAAKRCEIHGLEHLAVTCELVNGVSQLVHVLQRERGASSVFVASHGERLADQHARAIEDCVSVEAALRTCFDRLDTDSGRTAGGVRLFSRIAYVLNGLDALPHLRARISAFELDPEEVTTAFTKLIGGLLAVVFEAADTAADPVISRALVAMFNFIQGKELAGQERAVAAVGFAARQFDPARQHKLQHLIDAQQRCFDIFAEFAAPELHAFWRNALPANDVAEIERLRRLATSAAGATNLPPDIGEAWFALATRRIDAMKQLEDRLAVELLHLSQRKTAETKADLADHHNILRSLSTMDSQSSAQVAVFFDQISAAGAGGEGAEMLAADGLSPQLGRSILDLVHAQSQRLQAVSDELGTVRMALHERKVIERAKGLLMTHRDLTEDQAYKMLRQTAMDQGRRLFEVAETVLGLSGFLKGSGAKRT